MKKILVVVDMQVDFVTGALGSKEAQAIVPHVLEKIKAEQEAGTTVVFTKDTHEADYLKTEEGKHLPIEHCIKGTKGFELLEELKPYAKTVFEKPAFGSVKLGEYAAKEQFEEIELIGLCTDVCVISNAMLLKAFVPETPVFVDKNCCAGVTKENHENALEAMRACQINV